MYKILIVEDENVIRWGLKEHIPWEQYGFQVAGEAENGKSALELISLVSPDVVLVDIMMPVMNGLEFLGKLKEGFPDIKIIVLSGYSEFDYARQCVELGASAYLLKPAKNTEIERILLKIRDELDLFHGRIKKIDTILKNAGVGYSIMKEKFIESMLEGKVSVKDIKEQFPELEINLSDYFCVVLLQVEIDATADFSVGMRESKAEIINIIDEALCGFEELKCYELLFRKGNNLLAIICSKSNIQKGFAVKAISNIRKGIAVFYSGLYSHSAVVSAGSGNCYSGVARIKNSYDEAVCALKHTFFKGKGSVLHSDDCCRQPLKSDEALEMLNSDNSNIINQIVTDTVSCDYEAFIKTLCGCFELMDNLGSGDEEIVYMKIVEIMVMLSMKLNEKNIDYKSIYAGNIHLKIRSIIDNGTLAELKSWTQDICLKAMDTIECYFKEKRINPVIEKAKKYVDENYSSKITLEGICELLFISPSYFSSMFKHKTGLTFTHYLTNVRIARSKEILTLPDIKVYEVAMMVGYDDFRHFSKLFKKLEGVSPQQYRQVKLSAVK